MGVSIHYRIKELIEETNDAFDIFALCDHVNTDFAEFATLSLPAFKEALHDPELTSQQLVAMLRKGHIRHKSTSPKSCRATFLANYISNSSNGNVMAARMKRDWIRQTR